MITANSTTMDMDSALDAMSRGVVVITANRRLALELKRQYDRRQVEQGKPVWASANTISWDDWMHSLFQQMLDYGMTSNTLLSPQQALVLWEQIIQQSDQGSGILNTSGAARMADAAWGLMQAWNIPAQRLAGFSNSETRLFLAWAGEFIRRCQREGWVDASSLVQLVLGQMHAGTLPVPEQIILTGFDDIAPQQQNVLDVMAGHGCDIAFFTPEQTTHTVQRFQAIDTAHEIHIAARWSIKRLQLNHNARIGIVVPQLAQLRREIERIFRYCLTPGAILPGSSTGAKLYNISLGVPLDQCPLVVDAFLILRLATGELACGDLSRLLRSPFLADGSAERERRARLDASIRQDVGERKIGLDTLIRKCHEIGGREDAACPLLLESLDGFRKRLDQLPARQSPRSWSLEFQTLLEIFGWCRFAGMHSTEYQQVERFNAAVSSFQQLERIQQMMSLPEAIARLRASVAATPFQAQGGAEAPIQIVGILEAAGLEFDHLWVLGLSDNVWPTVAAPNPLLPISIQRELDLPHASPQRELAYADSVTARLLAGAPEVVVSHAASDGTQQKRVSPLVADLPEIAMDELDLAIVPDIHKAGFASAELSELLDNNGPDLPHGSHIAGGSWLLSEQSACPFRAFAHHRLGAKELAEPTSGLDGKSRGTIIHHILQQVWGQLNSHERLLGMDATELNQLVAAEVGTALARMRPQHPNTFVPRFVEIEQQRLTALVLEWLELEKTRAPFKVGLREKKRTVHIGGLQLDVVTDRIDELEDERQLIIDYKTGKSLSFKGWFEQRIGEPQLPLYATISETEIAGVALAGVNRNSMGFKGVCAESDLLPGIKAFVDTRESADYTGWDGLQSEWQQRLELLAAEILAGWAEVHPKDPSKDCAYCPLPALCRIHEQQGSDAGEDAE